MNSLLGERLFVIENDKFIPTFLSGFRENVSLLSETRLERRRFNYLKGKKVLEKFDLNKSQGWRYYSLHETVVLLVINILYDYGYDHPVLTNVVEKMFSDDLIREYLDVYLKSRLKDGAKEGLNAENQDMVSYVLAQKNAYPDIPPITNIEALTLIALLYKSPVSMVIYSDGNFRFVIDSYDEVLLNNSNKLQSFLTISISEIFAEAFTSTDKNKLHRPSETIPDLKNGLETIKEELPIDSKIEALNQQYANQDVIIKIRNSKKVSIKRLIYKNVKQ